MGLADRKSGRRGASYNPTYIILGLLILAQNGCGGGPLRLVPWCAARALDLRSGRLAALGVIHVLGGSPLWAACRSAMLEEASSSL